jgi:ribose transport system ATP-binding protein
MIQNSILQVKNLCKQYPGVKALDNVSIDFFSGEIHALVGENGAGKSTLVKCISGALLPDTGQISIEGENYAGLTPVLAQKKGIAVIYQEFTLIPALSITENIFLGQKTSDGFLVNSRDREYRAKKIFDQLAIKIDPSRPVKELSPAYQQIVEVAKAISKNVKILIMDEPTAPLTVSEVTMLFRVIRDLKNNGVTIIYISHRLEEIFEIADRVTVLRDGKFITTTDIEKTSRKQIISRMVGRTLKESYPLRSSVRGEEILHVENLSGNGVRHINFSLRKGEILGFAGLVGAGRTELMMVLYGAVPAEEGTIFVNGTPVSFKTPRDAIKAGIGLIPEDRKQSGLFLRKSVKWNSVITAIRRISRGFFVDTEQEKNIAEDYINRLHIKTPSPDQLTVNLSGGNQQKVVLAKTLAAQTQILIFDEPTRGIDVSAKQEIYQLMNELSAQGHGIILVSSDMPELLGMSDRIIVIAEGKQTGSLGKDEFDQNRILDLASGGN